jgi:hypothetical protein
MFAETSDLLNLMRLVFKNFEEEENDCQSALTQLAKASTIISSLV